MKLSMILSGKRKQRYSYLYLMMRLVLCFFSIIIFLSSCSDDDNNVAPATLTPTCKIKSQSGSNTGRESPTVTYTYQYKFEYTHNEEGNPLNSSYSYNYNYSDGKTASSASSSSNQYNDDGFIIRDIYQYNGTDRDGKNNFSSNTTEYTYDQNRLIKGNVSINDNGKAKQYSYSYEYDTEGRVIKYNNGYDNSYIKYEYGGNKIQKITRVDAIGNSTSPFLEFNKDGLVTKAIETDGGYSDEMRYEYDTEGQVIRNERHINGKPQSATVYEYDTKESYYSLQLKKNKGFPALPSIRPAYASKHNVTKNIYYSANPTTYQWEANGSTIYTYDYTAKGFPAGYVSKNLDKNGMETSTYTATFAYQDCQ